jgi:menaquinone-dependent protoporphyrinogen IX oxidase
MKVLVAYYSKDGSNRKFAEELAKKLNADIEEVTPQEDLSKKGVIGLCLDVFTNKMETLKAFSKDLMEYDLVVLGTPTWAGKPSTPIATFIKQKKMSFKKAAFFSVNRDGKEQNVFKTMKALLGKTPVAVLSVKQGTNYATELDDFAKMLQQK